MTKLLLIFALLGGIMYLLYINGYMVFNNKKALTFIGSQRGNKASFTSCNGWMKRVVKFSESRNYAFDLDVKLSKGDMQVELLDGKKQPIMRLDGNNPKAVIEIDANKRYYLVYRFNKASGSYELKYE